MNAAATATRSHLGERPSGVEAAAAIGLGLGLLLVRPLVLIRPGAASLWLAGLIFAVLGALALRAPIPSSTWQERGALQPGLVLAVGVAALVGARVVAGPSLPARAGFAVIALNTMAAVAEEAFFRRFLYARLLRWGAALAVGGSALAFAVVHVPAYGVAAFWVDLGAGLLLSWQRWASGGWGAPAATHAVANLLAVLP